VEGRCFLIGIRKKIAKSDEHSNFSPRGQRSVKKRKHEHLKCLSLASLASKIESLMGDASGHGQISIFVPKVSDGKNFYKTATRCRHFRQNNLASE
jgi:hypothetical protein